MTIQEFIEARLAALSAAPKAPPADIEATIFTTLMSKKFRKYSNSPEQIAGIKNAIRINVEKNEPIKFVFPFGGYKLWRFEEAPEVDWAELFTMMYFAKWLEPVATMYKPGVEFVFSSQEIIAGRLNNLMPEETRAYGSSFDELLVFLKEHIPSNLRLVRIPYDTLYDSPKEFEKDLAVRIEESRAKLPGGIPQLSSAEHKVVELNVRPTFEQQKDPLWREKTELVHNSFYNTKKFRPNLTASEKIVVFTPMLSHYNCIAIGTTKTSIAKFWAGVGALQRRGDSYIETVLSPSQLTAAQFDWQTISLPGLEGKNFGRVRVLV